MQSKFYKHPYYLNSLCTGGKWLHDFEIVKVYETCVVERCNHCKKRIQFKTNGSNRKYMSYHVKQSLQPRNKRFYSEYPHLLNN